VFIAGLGVIAIELREVWYSETSRVWNGVEVLRVGLLINPAMTSRVETKLLKCPGYLIPHPSIISPLMFHPGGVACGAGVLGNKTSGTGS
jgi:hypothetical protein